MKVTASVPNQRVLTISKSPADKAHVYTTNNLDALDEAAHFLQSKAGFKLYMYLAKNQNKYQFALSSSDFCFWSGVGYKAYNSAFNELVENGYLVKEGEGDCYYTFYDKSRKQLIDAPTEQNNEVQTTTDKSKEVQTAKAADITFEEFRF